MPSETVARRLAVYDRLQCGTPGGNGRSGCCGLQGCTGQSSLPRHPIAGVHDGTGSPSVPGADIWARLSNDGGTKADVQKVLHFIAENWFKRSEDLSVAQKWGRLSSADVARLKADLDKEDRSHIQDFEKLIWDIARGTLAAEFFTSLAGLTASLKQIAFVRVSAALQMRIVCSFCVPFRKKPRTLLKLVRPAFLVTRWSKFFVVICNLPVTR